MMKKTNRARINFGLDVVIGIAFLSSALSGLVFLLPANFASGVDSGILGVSYRLWNEFHTWSSLAMVLGVVAHLLVSSMILIQDVADITPMRMATRSAIILCPSRMC
jgi:hypothetical protein